MMPNEPGVPAPAPASAPPGWRDIRVNPATPGVNIPCAALAGLATMSGSDGRVKPATGPRPEG